MYDKGRYVLAVRTAAIWRNNCDRNGQRYDTKEEFNVDKIVRTRKKKSCIIGDNCYLPATRTYFLLAKMESK